MSTIEFSELRKDRIGEVVRGFYLDTGPYRFMLSCGCRLMSHELR